MKVRDIIDELETGLGSLFLVKGLTKGDFIEQIEGGYKVVLTVGYDTRHVDPTEYFFFLYCSGTVLYSDDLGKLQPRFNAAINIDGPLYMTREDFYKYMGIKHTRSVHVYEVKDSWLAGGVTNLTTGYIISAATTGGNPVAGAVGGTVFYAVGKIGKEDEGVYVPIPVDSDRHSYLIRAVFLCHSGAARHLVFNIT
jgi:hypothetical protein